MIRTALRFLVACLAMAATGGSLRAKEGSELQPVDAAVFPLLNDQAVAVLAVDLTSPSNIDRLRTFLGQPDLSGHRVFKNTMREALSVLVPANSGGSSQDVSPLDRVKTVYLVAVWSNVMELFTESNVLVRVRDRQAGWNRDLDRSLFLVVPGATRKTTDALRAAISDSDQLDKTEAWDCREIRDCAVIAEPRLLGRLAAEHATARPELAKALAAAGRKPLRLAVAAPPLFAQAAGEILKSPVSDDGRPLGQHLTEIRWAAMGFELAESGPIAEIVLQSNGREQAERLAGFLGTALPMLGSWLAETVAPPRPDLRSTGLSAAGVDGDRVRWSWKWDD